MRGVIQVSSLGVLFCRTPGLSGAGPLASKRRQERPTRVLSRPLVRSKATHLSLLLYLDLQYCVSDVMLPGGNPVNLKVSATVAKFILVRAVTKSLAFYL